MKQLTINPSNKRFYSEDFIKGFECGTQRQLEADKADAPTWIPCSERLPREEEQDDEVGVLVTLGNGYSGLQYDSYFNGRWYDWNGYVIAWMPLPKPWKGADGETTARG